MTDVLTLLQVPRPRLLAAVQETTGLRASPRAEAAADILRLAAPYTAVTRKTLCSPALGLTGRYTTKAIDRAVAALQEAGVLVVTGRRRGRGGGTVYDVDVTRLAL